MKNNAFIAFLANYLLNVNNDDDGKKMMTQ